MPNDSFDTISTQFDADITLFQQKMAQLSASAEQAMDKVVAEAKSSSAQINSSFSNINIGKSLESGFGALRGSITSAMGPLSGLAGALEALGPAGIAATTAIAAAMATLTLTIKAADWASGIQATADTLGVTVEEVQKWSIMAAASGLSTEQFTSSMKGLEEAVGKVQDDLTRGKNGPVIRIWEDVFGVSDPKDAKNDLDALGNNIDAIRDKVVTLASTVPAGSQRNAVAAAAGIDPEVLTALVDNQAAMAAATAAAEKYGVIIDESVIKSTANASSEMKVAAQLAGDQLRNAFLQGSQGAANFSGALIGIATFLGDAIRGLETTVGWISNLISKIPYISQIGDVLAGVLKYATPLGFLSDMGAHQRNMQETNERNAGESGPKYGKAIKLTGTDPTKAKKGPKDDTANLDAEARNDVISANEAYAEATQKLTTTIQAEAIAEQAKIDDASAKKINDLNKQSAAVAAAAKAGKDKDSVTQLAEIAYAIAVQKVTDTLQKQAIINKENIDLTDAQNKAIQAHTELLNDALNTQAKLSKGMSSLTDDPQQKQRLDMQSLEFSQQAQRNSADAAVQTDTSSLTALQQNSASGTAALTKASTDLAAAMATLATATANHSSAVAEDNVVVITAKAKFDGINQGLESATATLKLAQQQQQELTAVQAQEQQAMLKQQWDQNNPLGAAASSSKYNIGGLTNPQQISTDMQNIAVTGLTSLSDGLADVIMKSKSFGDMWHNLSMQIVSDLLKITLQRAIVGGLGNALGGANPYNSGATGAAGGLLGGLGGSYSAPIPVSVVNSGGTNIYGNTNQFDDLSTLTSQNSLSYAQAPGAGGLASSLLSAIGLASGTDYAQGGITMVGENGPELMSMPRGGQVLPNNLLRNAVKTGGTGGGTTLHQYNLTTNVQASDAVLTSSVKQWISQAHTDAIQVARQQAGSDSAKQSRNAFNI